MPREKIPLNIKQTGVYVSYGNTQNKEASLETAQMEIRNSRKMLSK